MMFTTIRPTIQWFSHKMELTLQKHDRKKGEFGWVGVRLLTLKRLLHIEVRELSSEFIKREKDYEKIIAECVDIANMAMMIANNAQTILDEREEDCLK